MASRETDALIAYMAATGVPHVVTAITGTYISPSSPCSPHSPGSYHCKPGTGGPGLAVDFDSADLPGLYQALVPLGPVCAELIYGHDQWLNGQKVAQYDYAANIWNHVHIAVHLGTIVHQPAPPAPAPEVVRPMYDPPLEIAASLDCPTGGTWCVAPDGAVYAFGGAPFLGGANGKSYFVNRTAARLNLVDGKYQIVDTAGEKYGPGF